MEIRNDAGRGRPSGAARGGFLLLCVLAVPGLYLFIMETALAFKDYSPINGFSGSPWVGFAGFQALFASPFFRDAVVNTIVFGLLFAACYFLIGSIAGTVVLRLPLVIGEALGIALLLPALLPAEVYAQWLFRVLGTETLASADAMRMILPLVSAVKLAGIPAVAALSLRELHGGHLTSLPIKVTGLFTLASLMLGANTFFSLSRLLTNPLTMQTTNTLDTTVFRSSFEQMSTTPLAWLQLLWGFLSVAILVWPAAALARAALSPLHPAHAFTQGEGFGWKPLSAVLGLLLFSVVYFYPVLQAGVASAFSISGYMAQWLPASPGWLLQAVVASAIATGIAYAVSSVVVQPGRKLRRPGMALLLFLTVVSAYPVLFSEYILMRQFGLLNTLPAVILSAAFSASAVWAMAALRTADLAVSQRSQPGRNLLAVFLLQVAVRWSDGLPALLYLHDAQRSPLTLYRQMMTGGQAFAEASERTSWLAGLHVTGYWIALPALLLVLAVYVLLPRRQLLAVLVAWRKG